MPALTIPQVKERIARLRTMSELEPKDFCEKDGMADSLAQNFGKDELKPNQLYKVFQELKRIEREVKRKDQNENFDRNMVSSLLPVLAYNTARGYIPDDFYDIIQGCLNPEKLHTNGDFLRVVELIAAVLAYYKFRNK